MELAWLIILFVAGLVAMVAELFLPGAVLGVIGFLTVCGVIVYAFWTGHGVAGGIMVAATIALLPVFFFVWRNVLGRFWALKATITGSASGTAEQDKELVGKEGDAASPLRPSGVALIEGRRRTVVTRGEMLAAGTRVKVIDVQGARIVVKKA